MHAWFCSYTFFVFVWVWHTKKVCRMLTSTWLWNLSGSLSSLNPPPPFFANLSCKRLLTENSCSRTGIFWILLQVSQLHFSVWQQCSDCVNISEFCMYIMHACVCVGGCVNTAWSSWWLGQMCEPLPALYSSALSGWGHVVAHGPLPSSLTNSSYWLTRQSFLYFNKRRMLRNTPAGTDSECRQTLSKPGRGKNNGGQYVYSWFSVPLFVYPSNPFPSLFLYRATPIRFGARTQVISFSSESWEYKCTLHFDIIITFILLSSSACCLATVSGVMPCSFHAFNDQGFTSELKQVNEKRHWASFPAFGPDCSVRLLGI